MPGQIITIQIEDETATHMIGAGDYATLCGLDGDDLPDFSQVIEAPILGKCDCVECVSIWLACKEYNETEIDPNTLENMEYYI